MDKQYQSKKSKKKLLPVELIYQQVELGKTATPALDRAFDILFDEVLRRRLKAKESPQELLTAKNN